jgi:hypothetical protein
MPLSWNEIKDRALAFSREWETESSEDAEAKSFWDDFFNVFGITRRRIASFEHAVKKSDGAQGFIDLLWKGVLLVEHKSRGRNLDRAAKQATDYFAGLKERDLPKYVLVSDFAQFRLYNLDTQETHEFALAELYKNVKLFGFVAGYETHAVKAEDPVNIKAAERMGNLHDQLKAIGYEGHPLEIYLVRLLFCLFADDTSIFEKSQLQEYIEQRTAEDGSDLASHLSTLFHVLNTPEDKRLKNLDEQLAAFPYVNGKLFAEQLPPAAFDKAMRETLLDCCAMDWGRISPAIFGSLFQSIMDAKARRNLGAHYTSEANILKLIKPLFLDELRAEFDKLKSQPKKLVEFQQRIAKLNFFDPACGCGNFLVIAYREMRLLELDILRVLYKDNRTAQLDVSTLIYLDVDQFYGIEIEEFPAQIAQVALWLTDHQMNMQISEEFGQYFRRLPLKKSAQIVHGNALRVDWREACPKADYIIGNPPFLGYTQQSSEQKSDLEATFGGVKGAGVLDFVSAWYINAAKYMQGSQTNTAFVSTNSITQGEQVAVLWPEMLQRYDIKISFAHRTFQWNSEGRGKAAVHCVIVGFSLTDSASKTIFEYADIRGEPLAIPAKNINPYLVDAPNVFVERRTRPICNALAMVKGNQPTDGGNLLLSSEEKNALLAIEPKAEKWIHPFLGAEEFINNIPRWCLWLVNIPPNELRALPEVCKRIEGVKQMRLQSTKAQTVELAQTPMLFGEIRQTDQPYLLMPRVSSERRKFIPIGYLSPDVIASDSGFMLPNATLYHFGMLTSNMHMAWVRAVCGRLKSDYRYSNTIVYNNFPWPEPSDKQREGIEKAAQVVLDTRAKYPESTLADLYDPLTMPPDLLKAHQQLDKAVDAAYGKTVFKTEAERVAFLFERYQALTSLLPAEKPKRKGRSVP